MDAEIKKVIDDLGTAFDAFKQANEAALTEIKTKGAVDSVTQEKITRLDKTLHDLSEAKSAHDAKLQTRMDELEKKLNRPQLGGDATEKRAGEIKSFNTLLEAEAAEKKKPFTPLDEAGYDAYKAAFGAMMRKNDRMLSAEEAKILQVGSDPDGGYLVTPDTTGRIVKKVYETSPVRQNASVITISTDALEGIEDLGEAGAGYAGEHATSGDTTTPQIGKWRIPVFIIDTEPKATQQLLDDAGVDVEAWLSDKVSNKFSRFENSEFITGASVKIRGFVLGYTAAADSGSGVTWGTVGYVGTGTSADFASTNPADKVIDLVGTLKNDYLPNSKFYTRRSVITKMRKFKDGQGNYLWQPSILAGTPEMFMGYPIVRMEDMPTLASGSLSLAFGDLREAYQIVDRQGIRVLRDPYTAKPYVKFYTTKRVGGGLVNFEAIKLLKFS